MPEKAELAHMAKCLNEQLKDKLCKYLVIYPNCKYIDKPFHSSCDLNYINQDGYKFVNIGLVCNYITSRGKKIIVDFLNYRFVISCLMHGRFSFQPDSTTVIACVFDGISAYFSDQTNEAYFSVCQYPSQHYDHIFKDVGPDIMTDEVTQEVYFKAIRNKRISGKEICDFLLEQNRISGIGNWLRAEILYNCRINPHRPLSSLTDNEIYALFYYSKTIVWDAFNKKGLTIATYKDPYGNEGTYECLCYGKSVDPNGYQINNSEFDKNKRRLHWCPQTQF